jgi:hypothetical protein
MVSKGYDQESNRRYLCQDDSYPLCNVIMNGTNGKRNLRYRCWGSGVRFRGP